MISPDYKEIKELSLILRVRINGAKEIDEQRLPIDQSSL